VEIKTLQDILVIEDTPEILSFRCPDTGYLLWPLIRNVFIRFIKSDLHYKEPLISDQRQPRPRKAYLSVLKACAHNAIKGRQLRGDVLISSTGSHVLRDGLFFNRLSDHFAIAASDRTITMESLPIDWRWPFPRANEKVLFDSPILGLSSLYGKFSVGDRHVKAATALVDFVATRAIKLIGWSLSQKRRLFLVDVLSRNIASIPSSRSLYSRLFKRTGAKLLLRQLGSYGGSSIINIIARENGLITAEYQHGSISSGHDAYNFSRTLCNNLDYIRTLPQFLLGYGTWWLEQLQNPSKKISIGNPFRTEVLKKPQVGEVKKRDILVLGDGIETPKYLDLCSSLADAFGEKYRVVFRPHPLEREQVGRKYGTRKGKVIWEWEKDIYEAFASTDILISELSTGLFEAIGLVRSVFLWDTEKARFAFPSHPFSTFASYDDLVEKIASGKSGDLPASVIESIWASNWEGNYRNFLKNTLPLG